MKEEFLYYDEVGWIYIDSSKHIEITLNVDSLVSICKNYRKPLLFAFTLTCAYSFFPTHTFAQQIIPYYGIQEGKPELNNYYVYNYLINPIPTFVLSQKNTIRGPSLIPSHLLYKSKEKLRQKLEQENNYLIQNRLLLKGGFIIQGLQLANILFSTGKNIKRTLFGKKKKIEEDDLSAILSSWGNQQKERSLSNFPLLFIILLISYSRSLRDVLKKTTKESIQLFFPPVVKKPEVSLTFFQRSAIIGTTENLMLVTSFILLVYFSYRLISQTRTKMNPNATMFEFLSQLQVNIFEQSQQIVTLIQQQSASFWKELKTELKDSNKNDKIRLNNVERNLSLCDSENKILNRTSTNLQVEAAKITENLRHCGTSLQNLENELTKSENLNKDFFKTLTGYQSIAQSHPELVPAETLNAGAQLLSETVNLLNKPEELSSSGYYLQQAESLTNTITTAKFSLASLLLDQKNENVYVSQASKANPYVIENLSPKFVVGSSSEKSVIASKKIKHHTIDFSELGETENFLTPNKIAKPTQ